MVFIIHISPLKSLKSPLSKVTFSAKSKAIPHRYIAFSLLTFSIRYVTYSLAYVLSMVPSKSSLIFFKAFFITADFKIYAGVICTVLIADFIPSITSFLMVLEIFLVIVPVLVSTTPSIISGCSFINNSVTNPPNDSPIK